MNASRFLIAGAIFALPLSALAQSAPPAQAPSESQGASFESLDANSDGRISKAEAAVNANVTAQFTKYDKNGDGFIQKDEVTSANTAPAATPKP